MEEHKFAENNGKKDREMALKRIISLTLARTANVQNPTPLTI